jgi:hypothetical protein
MNLQLTVASYCHDLGLNKEYTREIYTNLNENRSAMASKHLFYEEIKKVVTPNWYVCVWFVSVVFVLYTCIFYDTVIRSL